jgi:hypothetical protein
MDDDDRLYIGRVNFEVYMCTAGVIDHTLLKTEILNQYIIIEFEWQNEESKLKSNNEIYWQIERIKNEIQLLFLLTTIFNIHIVKYVIRSWSTSVCAQMIQSVSSQSNSFERQLIAFPMIARKHFLI